MKHRYKITLLIRAAWCGRSVYGIQDWLSPIERGAMVSDYLWTITGNHPAYTWADAK